VHSGSHQINGFKHAHEEEARACEPNDDWAVVRRYMTIEKREEVPEQRVLAKKTAA
jgi:hypothetical protein